MVADSLDHQLPAADITDNSWKPTSAAPVDLVASCSTHAHNRSPTSASAVTRDVIATPPLQQRHGLFSLLTNCSRLSL